MITTKQLEEFRTISPFRPFALETVGGNRVLVQSSAHIKLPPAEFDIVIVFGNDGLVHHLPLESIASAAVYGPEPNAREFQELKETTH
jgi:hypothetical protein